MTPAANGAPPRRLIVNADDFGLSPAVNQAVVRSHQEGILTSASLMVNEPGAEEAVRLARENPRLGVGLHLTLLLGRAALPPTVIPGLVNVRGEFWRSPVRAGWDYYFQRRLRPQLRAEIQAQFDKFRATGLPLDHVNGHLHLHLHPVVFDLLMADRERLGFQRMRWTRDCLRRSLRMARGHWAYRLSHAVIYAGLSARARRPLCRCGVAHAGMTFGLLQNARVDEEYLLRLLPALPAGDSEIYSHPSLDQGRSELAALVSPRVGRQVRQLGLQLIRYQDL